MTKFAQEYAQPAPGEQEPLPPWLEMAFTHADQEFANHVSKHWELLDHAPVKAKLSAENDIPGQQFTRRHLLHTLGQSRAFLQKAMLEVQDKDDFYDACHVFIEHQLDQLFYVTNNRAEAQIVKRYFEHFLAAATGAMMATGAMTRQDAKDITDLQTEYYGYGLDAYQDLRTLIAEKTNGQLHSPVAYALAHTEGDWQPLSQFARQADRTPQGREMLAEMTRRKIAALLQEEYDLHIPSDDPLHFSAVWVAARAREVSHDYFDTNSTPHASRTQATAITTTSLKLEAQLVNRAAEMLQQDGPSYGLLKATQMFEQMRAEANQVPEDFDSMLHDALKNAASRANRDLEDLYKTYQQESATWQQPRSKELAKALWPLLDSLPLVQRQCAAHAELMEENFHGVWALPALVRRAEAAVDEVAEGVCYMHFSPVMLLYTQRYLQALRRELGESMHEVGHFDLKKLAELKAVEDKCGYYYESYRALRELTLQYTGGAYDRLFLQEYMRYAADTGVHYHDLDPLTIEHQIEPAVRAEYGKILKGMGLRKADYQHPMVPLIVGRAYQIATTELGGIPKPMDGESAESAMQREADFYPAAWQRAEQIFQAAIEKLSKRDPLSGEKHRKQPYGAQDMRSILKELDGHMAMVSHQGSRH